MCAPIVFVSDIVRAGEHWHCVLLLQLLDIPDPRNITDHTGGRQAAHGEWQIYRRM
jgi:hypothetical protein